jgi:hypothetical protein
MIMRAMETVWSFVRKHLLKANFPLVAGDLLQGSL